jgi:ABC-type lipoprotein export system ATPase subunit
MIPISMDLGSTTDPAANAVDIQEAFCLYPLGDGESVAALRGLSLVVPFGERLVVHGPNGSGKTTLLNALAGEQRLAAGRAVVAGLELAGANESELARWRSTQLGQIDQNAWRLLRPEFDVLANVCLQLRIAGVPRAAARRRGLEALDRLGLADLAGRRPQTLSGGQRQRVAVCAAVAHGPQLVLADEPTGELDVASADAVYDLLATAVAEVEATLVLVTHDLRARRIADRVVRIRDGRISETWRPSALLDNGTSQSSELLVVDARGWLRLPAAVRHRLGSNLSIETRDGAVVLRSEPGPGEDDDRTGPDAEPVPSNPVPPNSAPSNSAPSGQPNAGQPNAGHPNAGHPNAGHPNAGHSNTEHSNTEHSNTEHADAGPAQTNIDQQPIAALTDVVVRYDDHPVLGSEVDGQIRGVALTVTPGELVVIAGRSGAGKSTLLRVLLGLQRPDRGQVMLNRIDLGTRNRTELAGIRAACCAVVLQQIHLASTADAAANLDLARAARGLPADRVLGEQLMARLGLTGLAAISGRPVSGLSGGERQRLAVARAIAVEPALLVLDEPTSQLDEASAELMATTLLDVSRTGTAVLVASHDAALIAAADRVHELT